MEHTRVKKNKNSNRQVNNSLALRRITPLTSNQEKVFDQFGQQSLMSLHGAPGTGKSFLALYKALDLLDHDQKYEFVRIIRSDVSVRSSGFLPGNLKEKMAGFEGPYISICSELYGRADAYEILRQKRLIEFTPTAHLRGMTFNNQIVIVDECQNMSFQELHTIITRFGQDCLMVLCGDIHQDDLTSERFKEVSGYRQMLEVLSLMPTSSTKMIEFHTEDIVRSGFIKQYILAKIKQERGDKIGSVNFSRIAESTALS